PSPARTRHPHAFALDVRVELPAAAVLEIERVEVADQREHCAASVPPAGAAGHPPGSCSPRHTTYKAERGPPTGYVVATESARVSAASRYASSYGCRCRARGAGTRIGDQERKNMASGITIRGQKAKRGERMPGG